MAKKTQIATTQKNTGIKVLSSFLNSDAIKNKFTDILGSKANGFIASILSVVNNNSSLAEADTNSIYTSALLAASLDLPINQNLGFAYLIPYKTKLPSGEYKQMCQFQIGYKGFKQLALRTGQYKIINETDVREGEISFYDRLSGAIEFDWTQDTNIRLKKKIIGYVSYFKLSSGFESTLFMTVEELTAHAKKYSQTYKKYNSGLWKDDFDGMCKKTTVKLNISKNGPMSIEMQQATIADQAVIKEFDPDKNEDAVIIDADYVDNDPTDISKTNDQVKQEKKNLKQESLDLP